METEAELERFREQWRAEVAKNKQPGSSLNVDGNTQGTPRRKDKAASLPLGPSTPRRKDVSDYSEEVEPRAYHDLPDKEQELKLGDEGQRNVRALSKEPSSALEHYEHAVEKETQGQLGDSIRHYRRAFKVRPPSHYMLGIC